MGTTFDRFTSSYNTQLLRFNSRFWNPGTEAVDAFTCHWDQEIIAPVYLIPRVIGHARKCRSVGTLVVPEWPSAPFWLILYPNGKDPGPFITACLFKGPPNTNMVAIRLDFRILTTVAK